MLVLHKLKRLLIKHCMELHWHTVLLSSVAYFVLSWSGLFLAGEQDIIRTENYFYWIVVTASTVGYGDFSPASTAGKLWTAFFIIPFGLGLFALVVGRLASFFAFAWRKGVKGLKSVNCENHVLIIGWNNQRTMQLIKLLLREQEYSKEPREIVLCVMADIENPMPDKIQFVRVAAFSNEADMTRAGIETAACIIIDNPEDDVSLMTALYCHSKNPNAHAIAYFKDDNVAQLLSKHCPKIEITPSVAIEMIAKAAVDPGSSALHHELLDVESGMTQYSVMYPEDAQKIRVDDVFNSLKTSYQATLVALLNPDEKKLKLNPDLQEEILPGAQIYYIADERIVELDWSRLNV